MRYLTIVLSALVLSISGAAGRPLLERLSVHATGSVTITVPVDAAPEGPIYRAADGSWKSLEVECEGGKATFSMPPDAGGSTIVLLNVPEWLVLDDDAAPEIERVVVDERPVEVADDIDLGHYSNAPQKVTVLFHDEANPIDVGAAVVTLDGGPLAADAVSFIAAKNGDNTRFIEVALPDVEDGKHALRLRVPDAAAIPHFAEVALRFNTGPLLLDGGFEQVKPDGKPVRWQTMMWSSNEKTKAELKVVEGGHSGKYCAEILGIDGSLNLLFGQRVPLSADRTYVVKGYYQATSSGGWLSMIANGKQPKEQYLNSPKLKPAEEWTPFEWQFSVKPADNYNLYLRSGGKGYVRWDDVTMEQVEAGG